MEQSSFPEHEEPSAFQPSEFNQGHEVDKEQQEEYEAEQKDIEEGVDRRLAEMNDDDLDLVESEDEDSDDYINYQENDQFKDTHNLNPLHPLSRNLANFPGLRNLEQRSPGIPGQFVTSTPFVSTVTGVGIQNRFTNAVFQENDQKYLDNDTEQSQERKFLHLDDDAKNNKLEILYEHRGREIQQLKGEMETMKTNYDKEMRLLRHDLAILKGDKDRLAASSDNYKENADCQLVENQRIRENIETLTKQLTESEQLNRQLQDELDSANLTLATLHSQLMELQQSDTILKAKQIHEETVSSLRERHEKELFRLHQEINKYKAEAKSKDAQMDADRKKMDRKQTDYDILQIQKSDIIQEYQKRLDDVQKRLQQQVSENASYNYTNIKAIEQRTHEDREKYAQELLKLRDKEEDYLLLQKRNEEIKSKYSSLKQKVSKYQEHQRNKEQKYLAQIRQTQDDCHARLLEVKVKTKEAIENKNKQYQEEVLQIQKLFDDEMEKVTTLTLRCSTNILENDIGGNGLNINGGPELPSQPQVYSSNYNTNRNYENNLDDNEKENNIQPVNFKQHPHIKDRHENAAHSLQRCRNISPFNNGKTDILENVQPTTESLNKVI